MITVWGRRDSSNVQAVMWCLAELDLPCRRHDVGHRFGGTDTGAFVAMNPNRTVPVIQDGQNPPLWESGAILRYLANAYGRDPFWPADLLARTEVDRWAEWAKVNIATGFTVPIFWQVVRTPAAERDPAAVRAGLDALAAKLAIAETRLAAHPFLVGENFTLADIPFGHVLYRYFDLSIERPELPALADYYGRLTQRPAFAEHVMVPYDALRAD
ncbi:MAG: glutathione S-transferase family protein [Pseudomonadota bacterium]